MTDPTDSPTPALPYVDHATFTGRERMELQRIHDCDFIDLVDQVLGKASGRLHRKTRDKIVNGRGEVQFADDILRNMIAVVQRRTDPNAKAEALMDLTWEALVEVLKDPAPKAEARGRKGTRPETT